MGCFNIIFLHINLCMLNEDCQLCLVFVLLLSNVLNAELAIILVSGQGTHSYDIWAT